MDVKCKVTSYGDTKTISTPKFRLFTVNNYYKLKISMFVQSCEIFKIYYFKTRSSSVKKFVSLVSHFAARSYLHFDGSSTKK